MLHLRISDSPSNMDIYKEFDQLIIDGRPIVHDILCKLERGKYHSPYAFYDRFGIMLDMSCLSTGAKAALLTAFRPDMEINMVECGYDAIGFILNHIKDGKIVVHPDICLASVYYDGKSPECDVSLNGYRFTRMAKLSDYITDYFPAPMPYLYDGIEELEPHDLSIYEKLLKQPDFPPPGTRFTGV